MCNYFQKYESYSYNGYLSVNVLTFALTFSQLPVKSLAISAIHSAITSISSVVKPLVVTAGVPILTPLVIPGF